MRPIIDLPILFKRLLLIVPFISVLSLNGCAVMKNVSLKSPAFEGVPEEKVERNDFSGGKGR